MVNGLEGEKIRLFTSEEMKHTKRAVKEIMVLGPDSVLSQITKNALAKILGKYMALINDLMKKNFQISFTEKKHEKPKNRVFKVRVPQEATLIDFAGRTAITLKAKAVRELQLKMVMAVRSVSVVIEEKGQRLAIEKTEIVISYERRKIKEIQFEIGSTILQSKDSEKYLKKKNKTHYETERPPN